MPLLIKFLFLNMYIKFILTKDNHRVLKIISEILYLYLSMSIYIFICVLLEDYKFRNTCPVFKSFGGSSQLLLLCGYNSWRRSIWIRIISESQGRRIYSNKDLGKFEWNVFLWKLVYLFGKTNFYVV